MSLEHILLGMLREPATGYDLGREFSEGAQHFWYAERSQIYPTLGRLEDKGWLRSWNEPSERGPERKVYETTEEGLAALRAWLRDGPHIGRDRLAYIAQAFFLDALDDLDESIRIVKAMRGKWREALAMLEAGEDEVHATFGENRDEHPDDLVHPYAALRMGIRQYRAKLAWCEETLTVLTRRLAARAQDETPQPAPTEVGAVKE